MIFILILLFLADAPAQVLKREEVKLATEVRAISVYPHHEEVQVLRLLELCPAYTWLGLSKEQHSHLFRAHKKHPGVDHQAFAELIERQLDAFDRDQRTLLVEFFLDQKSLEGGEEIPQLLGILAQKMKSHFKESIQRAPKLKILFNNGEKIKLEDNGGQVYGILRELNESGFSVDVAAKFTEDPSLLMGENYGGIGLNFKASMRDLQETGPTLTCPSTERLETDRARLYSSSLGQYFGHRMNPLPSELDEKQKSIEAITSIVKFLEFMNGALDTKAPCQRNFSNIIPCLKDPYSSFIYGRNKRLGSVDKYSLADMGQIEAILDSDLGIHLIVYLTIESRDKELLLELFDQMYKRRVKNPIFLKEMLFALSDASRRQAPLKEIHDRLYQLAREDADPEMRASALYALAADFQHCSDCNLSKEDFLKFLADHERRPPSTHVIQGALSFLRTKQLNLDDLSREDRERIKTYMNGSYPLGVRLSALEGALVLASDQQAKQRVYEYAYRVGFWERNELRDPWQGLIMKEEDKFDFASFENQFISSLLDPQVAFYENDFEFYKFLSKTSQAEEVLGLDEATFIQLIQRLVNTKSGPYLYNVETIKNVIEFNLLKNPNAKNILISVLRQADLATRVEALKLLVRVAKDLYKKADDRFSFTNEDLQLINSLRQSSYPVESFLARTLYFYAGLEMSLSEKMRADLYLDEFKKITSKKDTLQVIKDLRVIPFHRISAMGEQGEKIKQYMKSYLDDLNRRSLDLENYSLARSLVGIYLNGLELGWDVSMPQLDYDF